MLTDRRGALRAPAVCQFSWQFAIRYGMLLMTGFHTPVQPAERCLFAAAMTPLRANKWVFVRVKINCLHFRI